RQIVRWVGTLLDVHEIVTLAEKTKRALDEERDARTQAERVTRMRDEFLAVASHELRSPLSAITGWSEILARKGSSDPMLAQAAAVIRRNAQHQAALINDLIDMSAVMSGKLVLDVAPLDVVRLTKDVVLSHLHAAQQKGVALSCKDATPIVVEGDARRLTQVLSNLIGNALKFTESGGRIDVTTWAQSGQAMIRVVDTGRGIASDFLPHVFDRMRQEDASIKRRAGGLGLGLSIARGLVHLHHGEILAESPGSGRGAAFTVSLPLAVASTDFKSLQSLDVVETESGNALHGARILLVDDEADAREVAQVALSSFGAQVQLASSAAEALRILDREHFDVLVSDIGMPTMDGIELLKAIRSRPDAWAHDLPAVALTAFAMESDRRAALDAGFQAYVTKPISLRRLYEGITQAQAQMS
ncbi:MAG TPA: ATP-binding protein, partial [Burkholderiaceae bacterium]|nr:ATP-binding protein [Burkholderiaceae bacterium]